MMRMHPAMVIFDNMNKSLDWYHAWCWLSFFASFWSWIAPNPVLTAGQVRDNYSQNRFYKYIHKILNIPKRSIWCWYSRARYFWDKTWKRIGTNKCWTDKKQYIVRLWQWPWNWVFWQFGILMEFSTLHQKAQCPTFRQLVRYYQMNWWTNWFLNPGVGYFLTISRTTSQHIFWSNISQFAEALPHQQRPDIWIPTFVSLCAWRLCVWVWRS